ncbi:hypothetical protein [Ornithinimicrobium kibberense]|uniref:hypothetical protein n=1 Tax=Ornithinimicrobium kibberense TaxID=282060 RepID=UPI003622F201
MAVPSTGSSTQHRSPWPVSSWARPTTRSRGRVRPSWWRRRSSSRAVAWVDSAPSSPTDTCRSGDPKRSSAVRSTASARTWARRRSSS